MTLEKQDEREGKLYVCFVLLLGRRRLGYTLRRSQSETKTREGEWSKPGPIGKGEVCVLEPGMKERENLG